MDDKIIVRRRINHGISVKGIVQYEGTVEITGGTQDDLDAEMAKMEASLAKLQPDYEEFVEPLPKAV